MSKGEKSPLMNKASEKTGADKGGEESGLYSVTSVASVDTYKGGSK